MHIYIDQIKYIGKESNKLEYVEVGLIHSAQISYTKYTDLHRDEWDTKIRPRLKHISLSQPQDQKSAECFDACRIKRKTKTRKYIKQNQNTTLCQQIICIFPQL